DLGVRDAGVGVAATVELRRARAAAVAAPGQRSEHRREKNEAKYAHASHGGSSLPGFSTLRMGLRRGPAPWSILSLPLSDRENAAPASRRRPRAPRADPPRRVSARRAGAR